MANKENESTTPRQTTSIPLPKSKRGFKGFFSDVGRELRKVTWPKPAETNRLTGVVLAVCLLMALVLMGMGTVSGTFVSLITKGTVQ